MVFGVMDPFLEQVIQISKTFDMNKNNLKYINKKFSEKFLLPFNKISSSAKKSAVMCLFLEKNNKTYFPCMLI